MGWQVFGIAIPTKLKEYHLDDIADFLSSSSIIEASSVYNRNVHNTTICRYETGILIFNKELANLFFQQEISGFERRLFDYFDKPECILGVISTDDCYVGYSVVTYEFIKRFRINNEHDISEITDYGEPVSEEIVWLNALKKEIQETEDWSFEVSYFLDNPEEIFVPWEVLRLIQIDIMNNRFGYYWEDAGIEMKNYRIKI